MHPSIHVCECKSSHTTALVWNSEDNLGCQPLSTLSETGSYYCFSTVYASLAGLPTPGDSLVSIFRLPTGALGLQVLTLRFPLLCSEDSNSVSHSGTAGMLTH